jgi:hypothetical protein
MRPIREIIYDHEFPRNGAQQALPFGIKSILVDHQPIDTARKHPGHAFDRLPGIVTLKGRPCRSPIQFDIPISAHIQQIEHPAGQIPADKGHFSPIAAQLIGQRQTTHQMAAADLDGSIGPKNNLVALMGHQFKRLKPA